MLQKNSNYSMQNQENYLDFASKTNFTWQWTLNQSDKAKLSEVWSDDGGSSRIIINMPGEYEIYSRELHDSIELKRHICKYIVANMSRKFVDEAFNNLTESWVFSRLSESTQELTNKSIQKISSSKMKVSKSPAFVYEE